MMSVTSSREVSVQKKVAQKGRKKLFDPRWVFFFVQTTGFPHSWPGEKLFISRNVSMRQDGVFSSWGVDL